MTQQAREPQTKGLRRASRGAVLLGRQPLVIPVCLAHNLLQRLLQLPPFLLPPFLELSKPPFDTRIERRMMDRAAIDAGRGNWTTAADMEALLSTVAAGNCVSGTASRARKTRARSV